MLPFASCQLNHPFSLILSEWSQDAVFAPKSRQGATVTEVKVSTPDKIYLHFYNVPFVGMRQAQTLYQGVGWVVQVSQEMIRVKRKTFLLNPFKPSVFEAFPVQILDFEQMLEF